MLAGTQIRLLVFTYVFDRTTKDVGIPVVHYVYFKSIVAMFTFIFTKIYKKNLHVLLSVIGFGLMAVAVAVLVSIIGGTLTQV